MLDLETLVEKKRTIQTEDEELDSICGKMKTSFEESLKKSQSQNEGSKDLSARLENVKNEKERIMRDDHELEISNAKLWETTERIKQDTERVTVISSKLEKDSKEINEIFKQINDERLKLIDQDKLLNARYPAIMESLQLVCQQRIDLQLLVKEDSSKEESEKMNDLELAVAQQNIEQQFENWKKEKENFLKDNADLDKILESLLVKNEILKQKRTEIFEKKILLSKESDKVASIFEKNQASKEELIKQFKFEEDKIESIVKESSASYSSAKDMQFFSDDFSKVKAKKEQLVNKITKYNEEITKMKEKQVVLLQSQAQKN